MKKMVWSKFRSPFKCTGNYEKRREHCSVNVNEEYIAAHRSDSYTELLNKVESQQRRKSLDRLSSSAYTHLSEYVLEPRQETLVSLIRSSNLHPLIIAYFQASFEACNTCGIVLNHVHQVRKNYKIIQTVIKLTNGISYHGSYTDTELRGIFDELALFTIINNPMTSIKPSQFHDKHNSYSYLLRRLLKKFKSIRRRAKIARYCKKVGGYTLICASTALLLALLIVAIHSMVGIFVAPGVISYSFGLIRRNKSRKSSELKRSLSERMGIGLEVAAKGLFIVINEFDTISRLVKRLQDEIEHIKVIADICVKNGKCEVLIEVVKEFRLHEKFLLEQLEELEEHIYLCFVTINRSRRLVIQEIMVLQKD